MVPSRLDRSLFSNIHILITCRLRMAHFSTIKLMLTKMGWNHSTSHSHSSRHILDMELNQINISCRYRHSYWISTKHWCHPLHSCYSWNHRFILVINRINWSNFSHHISPNCCHSWNYCHSLHIWISLWIINWIIRLDRSHSYHRCPNLIFILLYSNNRLSNSLDMVINQIINCTNSWNRSWNSCCCPNPIHLSHNCRNRNHLGFKCPLICYSNSNSHYFSTNISICSFLNRHRELHHSYMEQHTQHLCLNHRFIPHSCCHRSLQ